MALEPFIDGQTMKIHHTRHHQTYVDKLNSALEKYPDLGQKDIKSLLSEIEDVPQEIRQQVINHGGGHANHSFFWEIMHPTDQKLLPTGNLLDSINNTFGSFDEFKKLFSEKAMGVFGSGWAFLILDKDNNLKLKRHSFQNSPLMYGATPILGIDVWEHAYYLKYQNRRQEYVDAWWNVVNWNKVEEIFNASFNR
jgi:Fe-Mn family superoxide dismutase